jgi:tRNA(Arg) A34 adenosine deaminase TadA
MQQALALACAVLEVGELPIAAVIELDGEIVASGATSERADGCFLVHAELKALQNFDRLGLSMAQRRQARLHTTLEPCLMCMGAAMSAFIGSVRFALASPADGAVGLEHRAEVRVGCSVFCGDLEDPAVERLPDVCDRGPAVAGVAVVTGCADVQRPRQPGDLVEDAIFFDLVVLSGDHVGVVDPAAQHKGLAAPPGDVGGHLHVVVVGLVGVLVGKRGPPPRARPPRRAGESSPALTTHPRCRPRRARAPAPRRRPHRAARCRSS